MPVSSDFSDEQITGTLNEHGGNKTAAASALGLSRAAFRRRMARMYAGMREPATEAISGKDHRRYIDEIAMLKRQVRDLTRQAINDDAMREIIGSLASAKPSPPSWLVRVQNEGASSAGEVPVVIWADWHISEVVSKSETRGINEYNIDISKSRVRRLVDNTIHLINNHGPKNAPGIIVNLAGDFSSGGLHPELLKTDELEILPSILEARDLLLWALKRIADSYGRVFVPCVAGNHGRMTQKPEFKRYVYKNSDWFIYQLLTRDLADDPRFTFMINDSNEADYRVYGTRFKLVHGDMLGVKGGDGIIGAIGPIMRGEIKTRGQSASIGLDYDILLMGHWHQQLWLSRCIVANTLKGFDEYARLALRSQPSEPSQPLFFVHHRRGITSRWEVKVEDKPLTSSEWISWKAN